MLSSAISIEPPPTAAVDFGSEAFEHAPVPMLVLGPERRILAANLAAADLLQAGRLALDRYYALSRHDACEDDRLQQFFNPLDTLRPSRDLIVAGPDGRMQRLQVALLPSGRILLLVHALHGQRDLSIGPLAAAWRLTPAEERLLTQLASRVPPNQAAEVLGISVSTVRAHIRSMLLKSGSRNLSDLLCTTVQVV